MADSSDSMYSRYDLDYEKWQQRERINNAEKPWLPTRTCFCEACWKEDTLFEYMLLAHVNDNHKYDKLQRQYREYVNTHCPMMIAKQSLKPKHHKGNGKFKGIWVGTLTMSTADPTNEEEMVCAIKKIFNQRTCPVEKYAWYLEYTDAGTPHIHFCYQTPDGGRIHNKVFKRAWPFWNETVKCGAGHRGGYHAPCADEEGYLKYIAKDKGRCGINWN